MRRALLVCAAITFAIACTDNITEPTPDRPITTAGTASRAGTVAFATTTTEDGLSISTDKDDYAPGDTVHFTGSGWQPGEVLDVRLDDEPAMHPPHSWSITVGPDGAFHDSTYVVDTEDLGIIFTLTATSTSGRSVSVTFTDAAEGDVTQVSVTPVAVSGGFKLQVLVTGDVGKNQAWRTTAYQIQAAQPSNGNVFGTCIDKDPDVPGPTGSGTPPPATGTQSFEIPGPFAAGSSGTVWIRIRALACGNNNANDGQWDETNGQFSIPSKLAFITPAFSRQVNVCSPEITVQTQNAGNGAANPVSNTSVSLMTSSGGGSFYSDNTCSSSITAVSIPTTGNTASFYYKDSQTGTPTLTAAAVGLTSATQQEEITAAPNAAPVVNAGGGYSGAEGSAISIDAATATDPDDDPLTISWSYAVDVGVEHQCTFNPNPANVLSPTITCNDNGTGTLTLSVSDDAGHTLVKTTSLTVSNVAPSATSLNTNSPVSEGSNIVLSLAGVTDPSSVDVGSLEYAFDCGDGTYGAFGSNTSANCPTQDNGTRNVRGKVKDKDGGESTDYLATVTINNVAPTATFNFPAASVAEGSSFALSLSSIVDPSSVDIAAGFKYAFDCGDPSVPVVLPTSYAAAGTNSNISCPTSDNGSRNVKGRVFDKDDGYTDYTGTVTVVNVTPTVTIVSPADYSVWNINGFANVTDLVNASFTDPGTSDSHTCSIDWGNGVTTPGVVSEASGSGSCKLTPASNPYSGTGAGIYSMTVKVKDDDNGEGSASRTLVVYDPSAGFVTGGGWINSPAGACYLLSCTSLTTGRANFGFVSKYITQKDKSTPVLNGNTEFQFQAGNLDFHSESYEWLLVNQAGTNGQYKGNGRINGVTGYKFMLWATDGSYDTFRIRIWREVGGSEEVVYDNMGSGAGGFSTIPIGGGSIVVHTNGKVASK